MERIQLIDAVLNLCTYHHPENIQLPTGYGFHLSPTLFCFSLCCDSAALYCQIITGCHGLLALKVAVGLILASTTVFGWDVLTRGW